MRRATTAKLTMYAALVVGAAWWFLVGEVAQGRLMSLWWTNPQGLLPKSGPRITRARRTYILRTDEIQAINGVLRDAPRG
jgi:hypothetical protein